MSDNKLVKLDIVPGIYKNSSELDSQGRWINGDKVRFRNGKPEKIGGWLSSSIETLLEGICRTSLTWEDRSGRVYTAFGTSKKLYIYSGGQLFNATPIEVDSQVTDALSTENGSSIVSISITSHGRREGDAVIIDSQASAVGGITLSGEYKVVEVVSNDAFTVDAGTNANATVSGAGGVLEYRFEISIGEDSNRNLTGYGTGPWGEGTWGTPRASSDFRRKLRVWSLNKWGDGLVCSPRGGGIYFWEFGDGLVDTNRAEIITNAPTRNSVVLVSDKIRQVIALGTEEIGTSEFNPLLVRWSSSEDFTDWTPTDFNEAGDFPLERGREIITARQTKSEILVGTDRQTFAMRYRGAPFIFGFDTIANNTEFVSQNCAVEVNGVVFWMGRGSFYIYDGSARSLNSSLDDFIFDTESPGRLNLVQKEKVVSGVNKEFNEIIWFYPAGEDEECSRYVIYNYKDSVWYDGSLVRTSWDNDSVERVPVATDASGNILFHETGKNDEAGILKAFIESAPIDLSDGDNMVFVDKYVPDFAKQVGNVQLEVTAQKYPNSDEVVKGPFTILPNLKFKNFRSRGRQFSFKLTSNTLNGDFQIGTLRFAIKPDGRR